MYIAQVARSLIYFAMERGRLASPRAMLPFLDVQGNLGSHPSSHPLARTRIMSEQSLKESTTDAPRKTML
jgi:hypothetical protein